MGEQTVVVGFGVTGASAAKLLLRTGLNPIDLVVVDRRAEAITDAIALGGTGHLGDSTDRATVAQILSEQSKRILVTVTPDEVAVMTTMLVRDLCPNATVVTAVRDDDNVKHALRAGANHVINTSHWAGRALAMALN